MEVHFEDGVFATFRLGPLLSEVVGIGEFDHQLSHVRRGRTVQIGGAGESKFDLFRRSDGRRGGKPRDMTIRRQGAKVRDQELAAIAGVDRCFVIGSGAKNLLDGFTV